MTNANLMTVLDKYPQFDKIKIAGLISKLKEKHLIANAGDFDVAQNFAELLNAFGTFFYRQMPTHTNDCANLHRLLEENAVPIFVEEYLNSGIVNKATLEPVVQAVVADEDDDDEENHDPNMTRVIQSVDRNLGVYVTDHELFWFDCDVLTYLRIPGTETSDLYKAFEESHVKQLNRTPVAPPPRNNLFLFTVSPRGYDIHSISTRKKVELQNKEIFYPSVNHDKLIQFFENKNLDSGKILLMYGPPGTGKTTYIRHLMHNHGNNNILMLTADMINHFSSPAFVATIMANYQNSIILIEDAEGLITSRENSKDKKNVISDFLNLTDGLFADAANVRVLLTFNTAIENVDKAILRKGRLFFRQNFDNLTQEQANTALQFMGKNHVAKGPMSLAEIYNIDEIYE